MLTLNLNNNTLGRVLIIAIGLVFSNLSYAECPSYLANFRPSYLSTTGGVSSLLELCQRYQDVSQKLGLLGLNVENLVGALAPRFIKLDEWQTKKATQDYKPEMIYEPVPQTFHTWHKGHELVAGQCANHYSNGTLPQLSSDLVKAIHETSLISLGTGRRERISQRNFRRHTEVGKCFHYNTALKESEIQALITPHSDFPLPKLGWKPVPCIEHLSMTDQEAGEEPDDRIDYPLENTWVPVPEGAEKKQCGYILFPPARAIRESIESWATHMNSLLRPQTEEARRDPITIAAIAQKWLISIHPFKDGNGRMSRFFMDLILKSSGLPPAILSDMDLDVVTSVGNWTQHVGEGVLRSLHFYESCVKNPTDPECANYTQNQEMPAASKGPVSGDKRSASPGPTSDAKKRRVLRNTPPSQGEKS